MKLHRFIGDFDLSQKEIEITNPQNINQIKAVLRLQKGDRIILSDGKGKEAEMTLTFISEKKVKGIVSKINKPTIAESSGVTKQVNLYLAILKKENFELAVQKAVECGVANITPVITERTIKTGLNIPRLEKIILEASEQSGRNVVPTLFPIIDFKDALRKISKSEEKIIFHTGGTDFPRYGGNASVSVFIGPEGGFTSNEIKLAENSGFPIASLGPLTLRGETAAIVATYRAVHSI